MCPMSTSGNKRVISRGRSTGDFSLQIIRQPPPNLFSDEWFTVELSLDTNIQQSALPLGGGHLRLRADLHLCEAGIPRARADDDLAKLIIDSSTPLSLPLEQPMSKYTATIRCKIKANLSSDKLASVCINFSPSDENRGNNVDLIQNVYTEAIHLISYKLVVEANEWEKIWFKDEGGRDKCMQMQVGLCKKDDSPVYNLRVPLKLVLLYDDAQGTQVSKQDTLRILGPPKQFIDPETSKTVLRFRIEDVSKNHQGQDFKIKVTADLSKFADVAPVKSPSVSIRSKRNKRQRESMQASTKQDASTLPPYGMPANVQTVSQRPNLPSAPQISPRYRSGIQQQMVPDPQHQGLSNMSETPRIREAMQGVIRWTDEVVNGLYPLQWQVIGYAPFPDGTLDYNRPYHSMPNPNSCISRVLSMYSNSVREDLRVLMTAVEDTLGSQGQSQSNVEMGESSATAGSDFSTSIPPQTAIDIHARGRNYEHFHEKNQYNPGQGHAHANMHTQGVSMTQLPRPFSASGSSPPEKYSSPQHHDLGTFSAGQSMLQTRVTTRGPSHHFARPGEIDARSKEDVAAHNLVADKSHVHLKRDRTTPVGDLETIPASSEESIEDLQEQVAYVLAKQYKALRSGGRLGFPAYNSEKEILGFYQESNTRVGVGRFIPISRLKHDFGLNEKSQATQILVEAINSDSHAVHSIKDWGSVTNLVDHALVYDWSKNVLNTSGSGSPSFA